MRVSFQINNFSLLQVFRRKKALRVSKQKKLEQLKIRPAKGRLKPTHDNNVRYQPCYHRWGGRSGADTSIRRWTCEISQACYSRKARRATNGMIKINKKKRARIEPVSSPVKTVNILHCLHTKGATQPPTTPIILIKYLQVLFPNKKQKTKRQKLPGTVHFNSLY